MTADNARPQPSPAVPARPSAAALPQVANDVHAALVATGFAPHRFLGAEETADDWRRRGPLIVIRRDHVEVWWSVGLRPGTQSGPTDVERRMTPVLRDILDAAGVDAELSIPTREGDSAVWVIPSRPDDRSDAPTGATHRPQGEPVRGAATQRGTDQQARPGDRVGRG